MPTTIQVTGARVHNLKNISVTIPRNTLTVITGVSGSGKSSLAFDTLYAEGQRRYIETFSTYARNFLSGLERPDVDQITGLSPVISIEQKTTNKNPRSTVGTITEIYDYLRLLYARIATAYSYATDEPMVKYTEEQILQLILTDYAHKPLYILAPLVRSRKGHYRELLDQYRRKGYLNIRIDGQIQTLQPDMRLDRYKNHNIELIIDKLTPDPKDTDRLKKAIATAMHIGKGLTMLLERGNEQPRYYSRHLMCPTTGISYNDPAPNNFSFNSPEGACPLCKGLGTITIIDENKIIPDTTLSIHDGALAPLGKYHKTITFLQLQALLQKHGYNLNTPITELPDELRHDIIHGSAETITIPASQINAAHDLHTTYDGIPKYIQSLLQLENTTQAQRWADSFDHTATCPQCNGTRLKKETLHFRIQNKNIHQIASLELSQLYNWAQQLPTQLTNRQNQIASQILQEITKRTKFLLDVGLDYLTLARPSTTLSGGESQRIRLATQIGSQLVNVLYILDEPSIGLHQRDNIRLINSLKKLRDLGNTVIVVEHDRETMLAADYIIDIGPLAGQRGGQVLFQGTPQQLLQADTLTARWLRNQETLTPATTTPHWTSQTNQTLTLTGATGNNLKNVTLQIPLGQLTCVTGVSGSGKSTLINDTLQPIISQHLYHSHRNPLPYETIEGLEHIDKIITVDQTPIGRTPRSNPATYTGVFTDIRALFTQMPEAQIRGYKPGQFSFNVKGGRCETCHGNGYKNIAMNFLPDVQVPCETCHGQRYNRATLEVRFKGKSIADVLNMDITQALQFFQNQPQIRAKIQTLQDVGLGYLQLGQPSTTLSGGESQRIKLAAELARRDTGHTLYILDEPTTGLHFQDIKTLRAILQRLTDKGNTVIIIEHNIELIATADHIIDLGPEGGHRGGQIIATGTPAEIAANPKSITGQYLREYI